MHEGVCTTTVGGFPVKETPHYSSCRTPQLPLPLQLPHHPQASARQSHPNRLLPLKRKVANRVLGRLLNSDPTEKVQGDQTNYTEGPVQVWLSDGQPIRLREGAICRFLTTRCCFLLGCYTCRLRRKKCDEGKPSCKACRNLKLKCEYDRPSWWAVNEQRKTQKEFIKDLIKTTKLNEKNVAAAARTQPRTFTPPCLSHSVATPETFGDGMPYTRQTSEDPKYPAPVPSDFNQLYAEPHDPFLSQLETPHFDSIPFWTSSAPYEVDIKTEREVYVDDVPLRRDSSVSTFNTYQPPLSNATLPTFAGEDWINREFMETHKETVGIPQVHPYGTFESPPDDVQVPVVHIEDGDRHLLDYFFDKILRLVFPVLNARQPGTLRSDVILPAIESNRSYLHCCLSVAAVHLKVIQKIPAEQIDNDIQNHRYQAVLEISKALETDTQHSKVLESTLAFIFLQAAVGRPDDALRDVPWHQHFQAATTLIHRLDLPDRLLETDQTNMPLPPLNMTISAWIDILGSSMLGQMPQFAHTYRSKLLNGSSSGFVELMGCEDRVMYLIAEITCLDALRVEGRVDYVALCGHITTLGQQLDLSDPPSGTLVSALSETGSVDPHQLVKNITALFCIAARVYLQNLVPGFHRNQAVKLVSRAAEILELIPAGPEGFDGALVLPLLICGASSTPDGPLLTTKIHYRLKPLVR